tara:strand:- start:116 stop:217 length:102 start_codon:yes stop_codon:yes gene_type:complete
MIKMLNSSKNPNLQYTQNYTQNYKKEKMAKVIT